MSEVDDLRKALAGANSMIGIRESELELAQGRAAAVERENREMRSLGWLDRALLAESRIADLKHELGEYADKLDCMVDPEEHRQKLAEVESALCVERQAANHWMGEATKAHNDGCHVADEMRIALAASQTECAELREALAAGVGTHGDTCRDDNCQFLVESRSLLSRPTGTQEKQHD